MSGKGSGARDRNRAISPKEYRKKFDEIDWSAHRTGVSRATAEAIIAENKRQRTALLYAPSRLGRK